MKYSNILQSVNSFYKLAIEASKKIDEKQQRMLFDLFNKKLYPKKGLPTPTFDLVVPEETIITSYKKGEPVPIALTESGWAIHPITNKKQPVFLVRFGNFSTRDKYLTEEEYPQSPQGRLIYAKNVLESLPEYNSNKKNLEIFNLMENKTFPQIENGKYSRYVGVFFKE